MTWRTRRSALHRTRQLSSAVGSASSSRYCHLRRCRKSRGKTCPRPPLPRPASPEAHTTGSPYYTTSRRTSCPRRSPPGWPRPDPASRLGRNGCSRLASGQDSGHTVHPVAVVAVSHMVGMGAEESEGDAHPLRAVAAAMSSWGRPSSSRSFTARSFSSNGWNRRWRRRPGFSRARTCDTCELPGDTLAPPCRLLGRLPCNYPGIFHGQHSFRSSVRPSSGVSPLFPALPCLMNWRLAQRSA